MADCSDTVDMRILKEFILLLPIVVLLISCDGDLTRPTEAPNYQVEAVLAKYLEDGSARIDLTLTRNDSLYKKADITLGSISLDTSQAGYYKNFIPSQIETGQIYTLNIQDSSFLNVNLSISMPGGFGINMPAVRHFTGDPVSVEWTVSVGTGGYILATEPPDTAATDDGYEAYVSGTLGTIPADAFMFNIIDRILGTHRIYAVSYTGAPSAFDSIPFDIPTANNPANNITEDNITGRSAGMVIAVPDTIIVASQ